MGYVDEVLADSPLAYWRLGESSGPALTDASGNGRDGTYAHATLGQPSLVPNLVGSDAAAAFDGAGISTVPFGSWMNSTHLTVECWILATGYNYFLARGGGATGWTGWSLSWSAGQVFARFADNNAVKGEVSSSPKVSTASPAHVVFTYDGAASRIYVNGTLRGTTAYVGTNPSSPSSGISLGGVVTNIGHYLACTLDEVAIYDHALSAERVAAHYQAGMAEPSDGIVLGTATETATVHPLGATDGNTVPLGTATETTTVHPLTARGPVTTNRSDRYNGLKLRGSAEATWEPPVVEPPDYTVPPRRVVVAAALRVTGTTTDADGYPRPQIERLEAETPAHRFRFVMGGKDITYLWGRPVHGIFRLVSPLVYGSARITIPQIHPAFVKISSLRWMERGKPVKIQLVNQAGEVIATPYRGFVLDYDASGKDLVVEVGGQLTGALALRFKPQRLFRQVLDVGYMLANSIRRVNARFNVWPYTKTGIKLVAAGATDELSYAQDILAKAWTTTGRQWTVGRTPDDKAWRMTVKDRETIHATLYFDTDRVVPQLRSDITEQPGRIYATGINPDGKRIRFGVYPNLVEEGPAPYPFHDGRAFGPGTTDDDVDTNGGITVMLNKLMTTGYLALADLLGGYDADATEAIRDLQQDAQLPVTGNMNQATWAALYDLDTTGYDVAWSNIQPAAVHPKIPNLRRSATGQIIGTNPNRDPSIIVSDRAIDVGSDFYRQQIRRFARQQISDPKTLEWFGTATLNGYGLIRGDHTPGDPIAPADIVHPHGVRPGWNLKTNWDGGKVFHVSGTEVDTATGRVQLLLDTMARDTMEVWQVIARNRETRRNPARSWLAEQRQSTTIQDAIYGFDEVGGIINERLLKAGWNVIAVPAGLEGTLRAFRVRTTPAAEFAVAVFGRKVGPRLLNWVTTKPLTEAGAARWQDPVVRRRLDERVILHAAPADHRQPYGYSPRTKTGEGGKPTNAPLTGVGEDLAQLSYHTFAHPVLYVAIWVDRNTTIPAGRIMWPQLEPGV